MLMEYFHAEQIIRQVTLERECPHILRAFKLLICQSYGTTHLMAHPVTELSYGMILDCVRGKDLSKQLNVVVQDVIHHGCVFFPNFVQHFRAYRLV